MKALVNWDFFALLSYNWCEAKKQKPVQSPLLNFLFLEGQINSIRENIFKAFFVIRGSPLPTPSFKADLEYVALAHEKNPKT